jgi:hypothetical protein
MKRLLLLAVVCSSVVTNVGCFLNAYSGDPQERTKELINDSENLRQIDGIRERWWMNDQPCHLTPDRIHGGIQPGS